METIDEIVRDIRSRNDGGVPLDGESSHCLAADMLELADRIEAAHKRDQEDAIAATVVAAAESALEVYEPHIQSEPVGNVAKTREALVQARRVLHCAIVAGILKGEDANEALNVVTAALSAPPRNCDLYATDKEAYQAYLKIMEDTPEEAQSYFESWLFAEARGDAK